MKFLIAHISKPGSENNNSYKNYYFEKTKININENILWDDNKKNTLTIGDFVIFYCWGKRVEIHKVINFTDDHTKRPSHWDCNKCNILHLSPCLNTYSFKQFGLYDPPYSVYKQGFKKKNVYDLHNYSKLQYELNRKKETKQGTSFGGPCFPRDNLNFSKYLKNKKLLSILPETIDQINNQQLRRYLKIFEIENKSLTKKPNIGICGITYKDKSSVATRSPGELLKNHFLKKYNIFIYDQYVDQWKNQKNCKRIENLTTFYKKSDVIFICYRDKNFKKMEKFKSSKKKIIIDLWDYLNVKGNNIRYKRIGVS